MKKKEEKKKKHQPWVLFCSCLALSESLKASQVLHDSKYSYIFMSKWRAACCHSFSRMRCGHTTMEQSFPVWTTVCTMRLSIMGWTKRINTVTNAGVNDWFSKSLLLEGTWNLEASEYMYFQGLKSVLKAWWIWFAGILQWKRASAWKLRYFLYSDCILNLAGFVQLSCWLV